MTGTTTSHAAALALLLAACGPTAKATLPAEQSYDPLADAGPDAGTDAAPPALPDAAPPAPAANRLVVVTIMSAEVRGRMPNGAEWDAPGATAPALGGPVALYLERHPELAVTRELIGVPIDAENLGELAASSPEVDPMVLVQVGERVFRSPVRPRAFNPTWDFSFQFVLGRLGDEPGARPDDLVKIQVVDFDGGTAFDTIGATVTTVGELVAKPLHWLPAFGSVKNLSLQVATVDLPAVPPEPAVFRIAVPGKALWTDTGVEVIAGQRIEIDAADEVCTSQEDLTQCSGPEGQPRQSEYHLPGFQSVSHGSLVGGVGDTRFVVGRRATLVAPSSGRLRLGINDKNVANNRGSYAVRVSISPAP